MSSIEQAVSLVQVIGFVFIAFFLIAGLVAIGTLFDWLWKKRNW